MEIKEGQGSRLERVGVAEIDKKYSRQVCGENKVRDMALDISLFLLYVGS